MTIYECAYIPVDMAAFCLTLIQNLFCFSDEQNFVDDSSDSLLGTPSVIDGMKALNPEWYQDDGIDSQKRQFKDNKLEQTNARNGNCGSKLPNGPLELLEGLNVGNKTDRGKRLHRKLSPCLELTLNT